MLSLAVFCFLYSSGILKESGMMISFFSRILFAIGSSFSRLGLPTRAILRAHVDATHVLMKCAGDRKRGKKKSERDTSLGFTLAEPFVRKLASLSVKSARRFCTERAGQIKMKTASRRRRDCATQVRTARVKKFTFLVSDKYDKCHRSVFSCNSAAKISPVRKPEPASASSFIDSPKKQLTIAC